MSTPDEAVQVWSTDDARRAIADRLRVNRPGLAAEMTAGIISKVPEYARPADEQYRATILRGVDQALERFLAILDGRAVQANGRRQVYRELGAGELRAGRGCRRTETPTRSRPNLNIHPQTARHRLRHLTRLFGDTLDDRDTRFELQIALRADRARRA